jgi:hypothetical protein
VLQKYFSHPSSVSYLFRNFTHKTETLGHRKASEGGSGGRTSKIPKPPGQIIMIDQSEILSISQILFITLFFFLHIQGTAPASLTSSQCAQLRLSRKTIFLIRTVIFWGFFVIE